MASLALGVRFNPSAGGTTDFVYASTVTGYRVATSVLVNSKVYRYRAESADLSQWEYGTAIWSSTTSTLSRNTITDSSNSGAKVNFTTAPQVAITIDVPDVLGFDDAMSLTATQKKQAQSNIFVPPTTQTLTSGAAATYTTPAGCTWIEVHALGGGGGGAGVTNAGSVAVAGSVGGTTTFNSVNAVGGNGAGAASGTNSISAGGVGGAGGTGTATRRQQGSPGSAGTLGGTSSPLGVPGNGGSSALGPGAIATTTVAGGGISAAANSGGGGSGALGNSVDLVLGGGGGGGEFFYLIIASPAATYTYTIGAGGAGGAGATLTGGAGGSGLIFIIEHYGS